MKTSTTSLIRRRPQRDLDEIYTRHIERSLARQESFAPDFFHGTFMLSEIYESCAQGWVDSCAFVECLLDERGELLGYTVATFEDYFLTIEHGLVGEVADVQLWLAKLTRDRRIIVELRLHDAQLNLDAHQLAARQGHVPIDCDLSRLQAMEQCHLQVTRDIDERPRAQMSLDALARHSQTNVLSLIGLCARHLSDALDSAQRHSS